MHTLRDYFAACGPWAEELRGAGETAISGLCHDSRCLRPGELFVAIAGARQDGRDYLQAAADGGAAALACAPPMPDAPVLPCLRLSNDYAALGRMAELQYGFPARQLRVSAVTGTNGKTTVAWLLHAILHRQEREAGLISTIRYKLGTREEEARRTTPTPLQLQALLGEMVEAGLHDLVTEVSSHALHQRRLGAMQVHAAIFTNLTPEHLDYHSDMEAYFAAKQILFDECLAHGGHAVINIGDAYGRRLAERLAERRPDAIVRTFGEDSEAGVRVSELRLSRDGATFVLHLADELLPVHWHVTGAYNVHNAMAAATAAHALGVPSRIIRDALQAFGGVPGRLQRIDGRQGVAVFVDYAHTGDAIANCLRALKPHAPGRLVVVFGCGGDRDRGKRPVMAGHAAEAADVLIVTSDNPRTEDPERILDEVVAGIPAGVAYERISDRREAIAQAIREARPDDTILIAGKGHESYQEIQGVEHPFDDVAVAREAMAAADLLPEDRA